MKEQVALTFFIALLASATSWAQQKFSEELMSAARSVLPSMQSDAQLTVILEGGVSPADGEALAVLIPGPAASSIYLFIPQSSGEFIVADASVVESANFGVLGRPRTDYERYESEILEVRGGDNGYSLHVRTRAWRMGQRYTAGDKIFVTPDGVVMQK